jgi:hypothetical protein
MHKPKLLYSMIATVLLIPTSLAKADQAFSMDDINASLQMEYQGQLVLQPNARYKAPPKRRVKPAPKPKVAARKSPVRRPVQYQAPAQRRVAPPVRQHVAKPRVPHADELFEAATYGNVGLITRLLQQGMNVNVANSERETALHMAAANGRYLAVIYLINHGANIHSRTIKNWLPIHHAARFRKANIANYLVQKGSSPHARTSDGLSAIDMARTVGDQQLLRIFGAR